ncbi:flagellar biosynthesis anti-sigma factor FlgM [Roseateles sp. BYS78W]|uniref:Negative regulator of flagellin synthesis n=1 Tax=Pelomonas candidula TaxID=3299025 RepID=A0ABW7HGK3_9BURK
MRIAGTGPAAGVVQTTEVASTERAAAPVTPARAPADLASGVLRPAQAELAALPEVDMDKVAELKDALARGEIQFDADRLARLVQRYHGGGR